VIVLQLQRSDRKPAESGKEPKLISTLRKRRIASRKEKNTPGRKFWGRLPKRGKEKNAFFATEKERGLRLLFKTKRRARPRGEKTVRFSTWKGTPANHRGEGGEVKIYER